MMKKILIVLIGIIVLGGIIIIATNYVNFNNTVKKYNLKGAAAVKSATFPIVKPDSTAKSPTNKNIVTPPSTPSKAVQGRTIQGCPPGWSHRSVSWASYPLNDEHAELRVYTYPDGSICVETWHSNNMWGYDKHLIERDMLNPDGGFNSDSNYD